MSGERTLTCQELTEVLTDYLEGVMAPEDRARFDAHLQLCEGCVNYVSQMRQTIRAVHALAARSTSRRRCRTTCSTAFRAWKRGDPLPEP